MIGALGGVEALPIGTAPIACPKLSDTEKVEYRTPTPTREHGVGSEQEWKRMLMGKNAPASITQLPSLRGNLPGEAGLRARPTTAQEVHAFHPNRPIASNRQRGMSTKQPSNNPSGGSPSSRPSSRQSSMRTPLRPSTSQAAQHTSSPQPVLTAGSESGGFSAPLQASTLPPKVHGSLVYLDPHGLAMAQQQQEKKEQLFP